ncbi:Hypp6627 [Branchiostoma lanceolatum]|uniref:Hypp6627 protein n=1 Tax=Branchiostoma lanceolatum TaxID=7740 RepID=A0A8K0EAG7_BRALA|nr:Hypp6627 [Branchiostoma lanceolatum]
MHCRRRLCQSCSAHSFSLETLEAHLGSISLLADLHTITSEQDAADEKASFNLFTQGSNEQHKENGIYESLGLAPLDQRPPDGDHTAGDPQRHCASSFNVFTQGSNEQHKENGIYESLGVAPLDQQPPDGDHTAGDPQRHCASSFNVFTQGSNEQHKENGIYESLGVAPLDQQPPDGDHTAGDSHAKFVGTGKRNRDQVEITKPECIHLYNKYRGAVDTSDQMHHPLPHPTTDAVCPTQDTLALQASCNNITFAHLIYLRSSTTLHLTHLLPSSCQAFLHQPNERETYYQRRARAEARQRDYLSLILDAMDQSKSNLPHFKGWTEPKITVNFLMVGHTHEDVDAVFSQFSHKLDRKDAKTTSELEEVLKSSFHPEPKVSISYKSKVRTHECDQGLAGIADNQAKGKWIRVLL